MTVFSPKILEVSSSISATWLILSFMMASRDQDGHPPSCTDSAKQPTLSISLDATIWMSCMRSNMLDTPIPVSFDSYPNAIFSIFIYHHHVGFGAGWVHNFSVGGTCFLDIFFFFSTVFYYNSTIVVHTLKFTTVFLVSKYESQHSESSPGLTVGFTGTLLQWEFETVMTSWEVDDDEEGLLWSHLRRHIARQGIG